MTTRKTTRKTTQKKAPAKEAEAPQETEKEKETTEAQEVSQDQEASTDEPAVSDDDSDAPSDQQSNHQSQAPAHVTTVTADTAHITPVDLADTPALAQLLLDAADHPSQVSTTTMPYGWLVPVSVAKAAGLNTD